MRLARFRRHAQLPQTQLPIRRRVRKGEPNGRVSTCLHDQAKVGDILDVSAPAGDFVLTPSDSPLLLASAGAGITTVLGRSDRLSRSPSPLSRIERLPKRTEKLGF
jgi:ferredoxin-NADP reductase